MEWEAYCISKKIDPQLFQQDNPEKWAELKNIFEQIHPKSFTEQKKFLINDLRRKYLHVVKNQEHSDKQSEVAKSIKPVIKMVPKKS